MHGVLVLKALRQSDCNSGRRVRWNDTVGDPTTEKAALVDLAHLPTSIVKMPLCQNGHDLTHQKHFPSLTFSAAKAFGICSKSSLIK